jgi:hypothetical protein
MRWAARARQLALASGAVVGLLAAAAAAGADVIYSQADRHNFTGGAVWRVASGSSGTMYAQDFAPWFDATIEEIAIGGTWQPVGVLGFHVQLWEPTAPGGRPATLLMQWFVNGDLCRVEQDADGQDIAVFRTEDCGGKYAVQRGRQYAFVAHVVGPCEYPLGWTYDMASGSAMAQYWLSTDGGVTWKAPNPPPPPPEQGNPVWNFEFELRGWLANDNIEMIYDQARAHRFTAGKRWYVASYAGVSTAICAQNFTPRAPGEIQKITLGGGFGISGGFVPDTLVCEIWEPIAPSRYPLTRVKRWAIPTSTLTAGVDSDGYPTITADVSADPFRDMQRGKDYLLAAYSGSNYRAPLDWAIDVKYGAGKFWRSYNGGTSWSGPNWFGSPEDPGGQNPAANFEFVLEGPTGVLAASTSPGEQFRVGWNYIALPLIPEGSRDPADIIGSFVVNRLYAWDPVRKTILLYPDDFHRVRLGEGYCLWLSEPHSVQMCGWTGSPATREVLVPQPGAQWVGLPGDFQIPQADVRIRNDASGVVRTPTEDRSAADPWINWNWIYWDAVERTAKICTYYGGDSSIVWPWYCYWVFALRGNVTLIFVAPDAGK